MSLSRSALPGIPAASRICLGTATFGTAQQPQDVAFALLDAFAAAGGCFVDTAHVYATWLPGGEGVSERTIGAWMRTRGVDLVVGSKGGHPPLADMAVSRLRPGDLARDCQESLERLGRGHIDLWYLHRDDPAIPVGEIVDACQPLLRSGRIRALGASNWSWQRIQAANDWAAAHGATGFAASQIAWSLAEDAPGYVPWGGTRGMDAETLAWHARSGVAQIPYSSQAGGFFAKPLADAGRHACPANARRWRLARELAARHGCSPNAIALAWVLRHPAGGWAVVGPKGAAQMADTLAADAVALTPAEIDLLARAG
jgi:aryl-alcohol dehydrogenase-like predicted oxidoreductase